MTESTTMIAGLTVLLPTDPGLPAVRPLAPRLATLDAAVIGFLDNTKDNVAELFDDILPLLAVSWPAARVLRCRKERFSGPASPGLISRLARGCDAVIVAAGSCGSCTALSVYDATCLEAFGIPTATICTDGFVRAATEQATALGMPGLAIAAIRHPLGTMGRPEVTRQARLAWDQAQRCLTHWTG